MDSSILDSDQSLSDLYGDKFYYTHANNLSLSEYTPKRLIDISEKPLPLWVREDNMTRDLGLGRSGIGPLSQELVKKSQINMNLKEELGL